METEEAGFGVVVAEEAVEAVFGLVPLEGIPLNTTLDSRVAVDVSQKKKNPKETETFGLLSTQKPLRSLRTS